MMILNRINKRNVQTYSVLIRQYDKSTGRPSTDVVTIVVTKTSGVMHLLFTLTCFQEMQYSFPNKNTNFLACPSYYIKIFKLFPSSLVPSFLNFRRPHIAIHWTTVSSTWGYLKLLQHFRKSWEKWWNGHYGLCLIHLFNQKNTLPKKQYCFSKFLKSMQRLWQQLQLGNLQYVVCETGS